MFWFSTVLGVLSAAFSLERVVAPRVEPGIVGQFSSDSATPHMIDRFVISTHVLFAISTHENILGVSVPDFEK